MFWGHISEQGIESFHRIANRCMERRKNTKDESEILLFLAKQKALRNVFFDDYS